MGLLGRLLGDYYFQRGNTLHDLGRLEEAIASYDKILAITPDDYAAWSNRGVSLYGLGQFEEALASFDQSLAIKPDLHQIWYDRGLLLYHLDRYDEAIAAYDQALAIKPDDPQAWYDRGLTVKALGRPEEAVANYNHALAIKPDKYEAWSNRGVVLSDLGWPEEAIDSYDQALAIKPDDHLAWSNRGVALSDLGRPEEAIASYDQALAIKPDKHEAWSNRVNPLRALGRLDEAIASCDQALAIKPDKHEAWVNRSIAIAQATAYEPARTIQRLAFRFAQPSPELLAFLQQPPPALTLHLTTCGYPGQLQTLNAGLTHCPAPTYGHGYLQRILGDAHWDHAKTQPSPRPLWRAARTAYHAALEILTATDHPQDHLIALQALIRTHLALGDIATARHCQTQGAQVFNNLRQPLLDRIKTAETELQTTAARRALSDLDRQFTAFTQLEIDLLIAENSPTAALEQAEFYKNRSLTWILDDLAADITLSHRQIQPLLTPTAAAISWHQSPDNLTTFLLLPDQAEPVVLNIDRQTQHRTLETWQTENDKQYATYRDKKRNPDRETSQQRQNHPWRKQLATAIPTLQSILQIADIEAQLPEQITQLILIPHRDLHRLPLQALWSHRFTTRLLPSAQLGLQLQQSNAQNSAQYLETEATQTSATAHAPLLNIDDPKTEQPPLPFAQLESAILRSLTQQQFPNQPITHIAQAQATTTAVTDALTNTTHRSLHFSGHGSFNPIYPDRSALGLSDGNLTARAIAQTQLSHLQFINLAACETAITGKQDRTTEYVGLPSAFLKAGAKTILSTLWNVDEIASCWFSIHFYQRCFAGSSPSQALHQTQQWMQTLTQPELITWLQTLQQQSNLEPLFQDNLTAHIENLNDSIAEGTMDSSDRIFQSPYYWAGFTITGQG